jgi:hypothetical protein
MATATLETGGPTLQASERQMVLPTNLLTGIVLAAVGYYVGVQVGNGLGFNDQLNTGVLLGYTFGTVMFLIGIGFANYPLARLFGWPISPQSAGDEYRGAWRFLNLSLDHKVIGVQYLVAMLMAMFFGGIA